MSDTFTREKRSAIMRAIKSKNTQPEMIVRKLVSAMGYRYRLHRHDLPGTPDLVFVRRGKIIFVHGCFWHGHEFCKGGRIPKSNKTYWSNKINRNRERHARAVAKLRRLGWGVMTIWECQMASRDTLIRRLLRFLGPV